MTRQPSISRLFPTGADLNWSAALQEQMGALEWRPLHRLRVPERNLEAERGRLPGVVFVSDALGAAEALRRNFRLAALEREVRDLRADFEKIKTTSVVPINSFAPEPFDVVGPIQAVVRPVGDGYVASVFDANISASGDTEQDAIDGLKEVMLMILEDLESEPAERLGVEATRQLAVLQSSIRRR